MIMLDHVNYAYPWFTMAISHCNVDQVLFVRLQHQVTFGNVSHIMTSIYLCHIAIMRLCSSNWDDGAMFVTLWWQVYVHHIGTLLCLLECDATMFVTLREHDYIHCIAITRLCLSHCDVTMIVTLWCHYVHHIATLLCSSC